MERGQQRRGEGRVDGQNILCLYGGDGRKCAEGEFALGVTFDPTTHPPTHPPFCVFSHVCYTAAYPVIPQGSDKISMYYFGGNGKQIILRWPKSTNLIMLSQEDRHSIISLAVVRRRDRHACFLLPGPHSGDRNSSFGLAQVRTLLSMSSVHVCADDLSNPRVERIHPLTNASAFFLIFYPFLNVRYRQIIAQARS